jgi:hypothetical protein
VSREVPLVLGPAVGDFVLITDLGKIALKVDEIEGVRVAEFHDTLESDVWTAYITIPRADVLVVAWNRVYLDQLLRRRGARAGARALPRGLPEWAWLDPSAPFGWCATIARTT